MIESKSQFEEERDRLILRMMEVKILNTFNMYRIPFIASSFTFCLLILFRSRKPLHLRLLPLFFFGTFASMYNYQIGQYGVYKNIDKLMAFMAEKEGSEVSNRTKEFLEAMDERKKQVGVLKKE